MIESGAVQEQPKHPLWGACRLWSLWEMLRFYAERFHAATNMLTGLREFVAQIPTEDDGAVLGDQLRGLNDVKGKFQDLLSLMREMNLEVSVQNIEYLSNRINNNPVIDGDFRAALGLSFRLLNDELRTHVFLHIDRRNKELFEQAVPPFGDRVQTTFPSAIYEIEEAAKCLALERSTGSAVHSIRCLEAGIRALSRCLAIPDPTKASDRNWGALLRTLKAEIDRRWPGSSTRMSGDGEFFDNAYAGLAAMQNPWRNATMHLDQKYTPDEARHVYETVKGFMQKIASRMDENGDPKV
jgi:hypothetical protein